MLRLVFLLTPFLSTLMATPVELAMAQSTPMVELIRAIGTSSPLHAIEITPTITERLGEIRFTEGSFVEKGTVLAVLESTEEEAELEEAKASLREQERELKRVESLVRQKTLPEANLDEQATRLEEARARVNAILARIEDRVLKAPFAGLVGLREVSRGALLTPGRRVTTLDDLSVMQVDFSVPERSLSQLKPGQRVEVTSIAYPDRTFEGRVVVVDPRLDAATRMVRVRAHVKNPENLLRSGMLLSVALFLFEEDALTVPEAAVFQIQKQHFVWKISPENKVARVGVSVGRRRDGRVEVLKGLQDGDRLVASGVHRLSEGASVEIEVQP